MLTMMLMMMPSPVGESWWVRRNGERVPVKVSEGVRL